MDAFVAFFWKHIVLFFWLGVLYFAIIAWHYAKGPRRPKSRNIIPNEEDAKRMKESNPSDHSRGDNG